jgi:hypothetical protein
VRPEKQLLLLERKLKCKEITPSLALGWHVQALAVFTAFRIMIPSCEKCEKCVKMYEIKHVKNI